MAKLQAHLGSLFRVATCPLSRGWQSPLQSGNSLIHLDRHVIAGTASNPSESWEPEAGRTAPKTFMQMGPSSTTIAVNASHGNQSRRSSRASACLTALHTRRFCSLARHSLALPFQSSFFDDARSLASLSTMDQRIAGLPSRSATA